MLEVVVSKALAGENQIEAANLGDRFLILLLPMHQRHGFLHQRAARGLAFGVLITRTRRSAKRPQRSAILSSCHDLPRS